MMACCRWRLPIWLLLALLVFQSCASRKVIAPSNVAAAAANMEAFLLHGPYDWDWFACSGQMRMESPFFSGSGQYNLRMKSDSLVWMVVKYMGLEVARLQATADSVVLINRWERKVEVYSWAEIRRQTGFPASLNSLQRLVMGWLPLRPEQWEQTGQDEGAALIQARESGIQIQAAIEEPPFRLTRCLFREQGTGMEIRGRQEGWTSLQGRDFSHARYWEMKPDPDSRVFLQVLIQDGSFSGPLLFPFSIPDRYARGD
jgi:hypothetical protein